MMILNCREIGKNDSFLIFLNFDFHDSSAYEIENEIILSLSFPFQPLEIPPDD